MVICSVVGARPNFMKIAPVFLELKRRGIPQLLVHTGQHYDANMSQIFFEELGLPVPDIYLGVGSDTHARQTARIMVSFEEVCHKNRPDLVVVGGDVNSTMAAALVAAKEHIPVAHVEAGLRSFDRSMPEEINRVATDHLSDLLFTTEKSADKNLRREGVPPESIHFVGNCMADTLLKHVDVAIRRSPWETFGLKPSEFALVTLHRPSNVDDSEILKRVMKSINDVSSLVPGPSPDPHTPGQGKNGGGSQGEFHGALTLSDFHRSDGQGAFGSDRLRGNPGRDDGFAGALPYTPEEYGAACYDRKGNQSSRGNRS
jgi:UDP-N-acetylglucosamine 2-epimerase (non-hydrolysing)